MLKLEQLQMEIVALPEKDFARLRRWFAEKDWEQWERQIEADDAAGKLDFLLAKAAEAKDQETLLTTSGYGSAITTSMTA
jgi:hypothetical protein